ncbi:hypothetical protein QUB80_06615 [Chlorogloeopsis sp. ULAP01]|nr:hypothetical protein [Chlorogloeopsis sp. ULAP01]MDM9380374.1 hypothetical protein [Chlorogloeopsis sp. ULAP01]
MTILWRRQRGDGEDREDGEEFTSITPSSPSPPSTPFLVVSVSPRLFPSP